MKSSIQGEQFPQTLASLAGLVSLGAILLIALYAYRSGGCGQRPAPAADPAAPITSAETRTFEETPVDRAVSTVPVSKVTIEAAPMPRRVKPTVIVFPVDTVIPQPLPGMSFSGGHSVVDVGGRATVKHVYQAGFGATEAGTQAYVLLYGVEWGTRKEVDIWVSLPTAEFVPATFAGFSISSEMERAMLTAAVQAVVADGRAVILQRRLEKTNYRYGIEIAPMPRERKPFRAYVEDEVFLPGSRKKGTREPIGPDGSPLK